MTHNHLVFFVFYLLFSTFRSIFSLTYNATFHQTACTNTNMMKTCSVFALFSSLAVNGGFERRILSATFDGVGDTIATITAGLEKKSKKCAANLHHLQHGSTPMPMSGSSSARRSFPPGTSEETKRFTGILDELNEMESVLQKLQGCESDVNEMGKLNSAKRGAIRELEPFGTACEKSKGIPKSYSLGSTGGSPSAQLDTEIQSAKNKIKNCIPL